MTSESTDNESSAIQHTSPTGVPKRARKRYSIWIGELLQKKLVTADNPELAVEIVYTEWGVERSLPVTAKLKYPAPSHCAEEADSTAGLEPAPAEGLAFKLGRRLLGWTTTVAEKRMGVKPEHRMLLEAGSGSQDLKAHARRSLEDQGVPMGALIKVATLYIENRSKAALLETTVELQGDSVANAMER